MKITDKVQKLKLAFAGLPHQRKDAQRLCSQALYDFQDEIASYFEKHLPEENQIYGNGAVGALKDLTDKLFKNPDDSRIQNDIEVCIVRQMTIAAYFIPEEKQNL